MRNSELEQEDKPYLREADSFDFKASLDFIKDSIVIHFRLVSAITAITFGIVLVYLMVWPPVFTAAVVISADSDQDLQRNAFYQQWNIFRREAIGDEAILMTSDPILRRVVIELDLSYDEVYHPFSSHLIFLWGESWVGKNYRKVKYFFFPKPPLPDGLTEDMVEKIKVLKDFKQSVSLQPIGEANVALLLMKGPTPRVAEIANKVIDVYLEERKNRYVNEAKSAKDSLLKETEKAHAKLVQIEQELQKFYTDNHLLMTFEKDRVQMTQWLDMQAEVRDLETYDAQLRDTIQSLSAQLEKESEDLTHVALFHENIVTLKQKLTQLQIALKVEEQNFQTGTPEIKQRQDQINDLSEIIEQQQVQLNQQRSKSQNKNYETIRSKIGQMQSDLAGTSAALNSKKRILEKLQPLMDEIPRKMQRTYQLQREQMLIEGQYKALSEKLIQASVSMTTARSAPSAIRIIDRATPPEKKSWPNTKIMLLTSIIFGGFLGVLCALTMDMIFVRARKNIGLNGKYSLYASLEHDERFLQSLYPTHH